MDKGRIALGEVSGGENAMGPQAGAESGAHAPDILCLDASQKGPAALDIKRYDQATTCIGVGLRPFIGKFAQHLRSAHSHGHRDACAFQHIGANAQPQRTRIGLGHIGKAQEGLVD